MSAQEEEESIFDVFEKGNCRKVIDTNGGGTLGVSFPSELREEFNIELHDSVVFYESEKSGVVELHLE